MNEKKTHQRLYSANPVILSKCFFGPKPDRINIRILKRMKINEPGLDRMTGWGRH